MLLHLEQLLAVSTVVSLEDSEIWVAFGTGTHMRYIPAHNIAKELGYKKSLSLPMFHAFFRVVTLCRRLLAGGKRLHLTYGSLSMRSHLARKHIFTTKGRSMDSLPPTRAAHLQHTKRAAYQDGYLWGQKLVCCPFIPSPETYGWQKSATQGWQPFWTLLPEAVASCSELLKCGCKKVYRGLCKCVRATLTLQWELQPQ